MPPPGERTEARDPVGDYKLTHELAAIGERLAAEPGHVVELGIACPACRVGTLSGRANRFARGHVVRCSNCTLSINR